VKNVTIDQTFLVVEEAPPPVEDDLNLALIAIGLVAILGGIYVVWMKIQKGAILE
jgi:hypothetical protein